MNAMRRYFHTAAMGACCLAAGCGDLIVVKARNSGALAHKRAMPPLLLDNFEKGVDGFGFGNKAAGGGCKVGEETHDVHSGLKSLRVDYTSGTGDWGAGFGFEAAGLPAAGFFDVRGYEGIGFWAKAPLGSNFYVQLEESKGGGGENYVAPDFTGTGRWKQYFFRFEDFSRNLYTGSQNGDNNFNLGAIQKFGISIREKQGNGVLLLDDIYFR